MDVPATAVTVRPFRGEDAGAAVPLLYESARGLYDRYAGSPGLARRALTRALARDHTTASADVVWVADLDGTVAGAMAAMPAEWWAPRSRAFLSVTLRAIPPWRWPAALWLYRTGARAAPALPANSLYVDSLATASHARRRGVARALLAEADRQARARGLPRVALDAFADNHPARALYLSAGFNETGSTAPTGAMPAGVSLVKELG
jgi:ribosomal protein S18 acetylase RimI-like enzyme